MSDFFTLAAVIEEVTDGFSGLCLFPERCMMRGTRSLSEEMSTGMDGCLSHDGIQQFLRRVGSYVGQFAFAILVFGDNGPFAEERMLCISQRGGCLGNQEFIPVAYLVLSL